MDSDQQPARPRRLPAADYDVVDADLGRDRDTVIGLWRGTIGWQDQLDRMYDVFYLRCPFGRPRIKLLRYRPTGAIVGTIGLGPRPMLWRGGPCTAGVLSHFVVTRPHRSLLPAVKLMRAMAKTVADTLPIGYGLSTPTGSAVIRRAGHAAPTALRRWVKPLRWGPFARERGGRLAGIAGGVLDGALATTRALRAPWRQPHGHAEWSAEVDPRMQALWESSAHGDGLMTVRSTGLLRWRFLALPAIDRRFLLVAPARGAPLSAWFVCETNVRRPAFMTVTDAWFAAGVDGADRHAIRQLCGHARAAGYAAIETRVTAAPAVTAAWRAEGFAPHGEQPFFLYGVDVCRPDGSFALHITDVEQDG